MSLACLPSLRPSASSGAVAAGAVVVAAGAVGAAASSQPEFLLAPYPWPMDTVIHVDAACLHPSEDSCTWQTAEASAGSSSLPRRATEPALDSAAWAATASELEDYRS